MPRGGARFKQRDNDGRGGRRVSIRPDAKKGGRPRAFVDVRLPIAETPALLSWLAEQRATLDIDHPAARGLDYLIAALWTETAHLAHNAADEAAEQG